MISAALRHSHVSRPIAFASSLRTACFLSRPTLTAVRSAKHAFDSRSLAQRRSPASIPPRSQPLSSEIAESLESEWGSPAPPDTFAHLDTEAVFQKMQHICQLPRGVQDLDPLLQPPYSDTGLRTREYRLSSREYDLPINHRENNFETWRQMHAAAMQTQQDLATVEDLFESLLSRRIGYASMEWALQMYVFARIFRAAGPTQRFWHLLEQMQSRLTSWKPSTDTLRLILHFMRLRKDWDHAQILIENLHDTIDEFFLLETAVWLLISPLLSLQDCGLALAEGVTMSKTLDNIPLGLLAALVSSISRARRAWASLPITNIMASKLEDSLSVPNPPLRSHTGSRDVQIVAALAAQKSLSSSPEAFREWVRTSLAPSGALQNAAIQDVAYAIFLRSDSACFDACETEEDVRRLFLHLRRTIPEIGTPGRSAWGWGIRVLLGQTSNLLCVNRVQQWRLSREPAEKRPSDEGLGGTPSPLHTHEANLLFNFFVSKDPYSVNGSHAPTSFMVLPLMEALLRQFPPHTDRAVEIYRLMAYGGPRRELPQAFAPILRHLKPTATENSAHGHNGEAVDLLLDHLFKEGGRQIETAKELMLGIARAGRITLLHRQRRVENLIRLITAVAHQRSNQDVEQDVVILWSFLCEAARGNPRRKDSLETAVASVDPPGTTWCSDFLGYHWHLLFEALIGETTPLIPISLMPMMVQTAMKSGVPLSHPKFRILLWKLGLLATRRLNISPASIAMGPLQPPTREEIFQTVKSFHFLLARGEAASGFDPRMIGALMNAYNRVGAPWVVHEIWQALALATSKAQSSDRCAEEADSIDQNRTDTSPIINGAILSIYLDTCGWHGAELLGRRAWEFASSLDAEGRASPVRDLNAWDSWLEFLCRCGRLAEAVGPQLDAMMMACPSGPQAKTLRMLLAFGACRA